MYRAQGPVELRPVGEVEFANGVAAMAASGTYGRTQQTERACWSNGIKRVHVTHRMEISSGYRLISQESAKEACR
jgi:hypothetical protein